VISARGEESVWYPGSQKRDPGHPAPVHSEDGAETNDSQGYYEAS